MPDDSERLRRGPPPNAARHPEGVHPAIAHHKQAARHLEHAAEQHREAVVHLERGQHETAGRLAQQAMASGGEAVAAAHEAVRVHQDHKRATRP